jgi:hypothetical protein
MVPQKTPTHKKLILILSLINPFHDPNPFCRT